MESSSREQQQLIEAERAGAAPYVEYPPTPVWYAPAVGVWSGVMVFAIGGIDDHPLVFVPVLLALAVTEGMFIGWYRRYRGTMPSMWCVPREISAAMRGYLIGYVVVLASTIAVWLAAGAFPASITAFVTVTIGLFWYERSYAAAAQQTRARLG